MAQKCNIPKEEAERLLREIPDITDAQDEQVAGLFPHYLFFRKHKEGRELQCSGCNKHWLEPWLAQIDTPERRTALFGKHDELTRCPRCGRVVTMKNDGITKSGDKLWREIPVLFLLADGEGGLYGRFALARKGYAATRTPKVALFEKSRFYWRMPDGEHPEGMVGRWDFKRNWTCEDGYSVEGWNVLKTCGEPWALEVGTYYERHIEDYQVIGWDALEQSGLRYNGYRALFGDGGRTRGGGTTQGSFPTERRADMESVSAENPRNHGLCTWLGYYAAGMPQLEFVAKLGLRGFARELLDSGKKNCALLDWKQQRPDKFLRLRPETVKAVLKAGLQGPEQLRAAQGMDKRGMRPEVIAELIDFSEQGVFEDIFAVADLCGAPVPRLCRYIKQQAASYKSVKDAGQCWADYIRECRALGFDLRQQPVAMPRSLALEHGTTSGLVKAQGNKLLNKGYRDTLLPKLRKRYEYDDGTLCVLVPSGMEAIIGEGQRLHHCVGGYAERHVTGKTVILFLRESAHKTKSLCTIELKEDGKTIRQIHGYRNDEQGVRPREAYASLLDPWLAWIAAGSPRGKDGLPKMKKKREEQTA